MVPDRFAEQRAGGILVSGLENERSEVVQRGEIGGPTADEIEIVALCLFEVPLFAQQAGSLEPGVNRIRIVRQYAIEVFNAGHLQVRLRPIFHSEIGL